MVGIKSKELLDSFQRLNRAIKRRSALISPDTYGRNQSRVLRIIAAHDGINARDLANLLEIKPPSLTVKLNKLEEDGNIVRQRDESDGRFTYIHITPQGFDIISRRDEDKKSVKQDFADCLTYNEKQTFCDMCDRLSFSLNNIIDEERHDQDAQLMAKLKLFQADEQTEK